MKSKSSSRLLRWTLRITAFLGGVVAEPLVVGSKEMAGQKLLASAVASGLTDTWQIVAFGGGRRPAHDRLHLGAYFEGCSEDQLRFSVPKRSSPAHKQAFDLRSGRASRVHYVTPTKRQRIALATYIWFYICVPEVDPSRPSDPRRRLRCHGVRWTARPESPGRFTRPVGR